MINVTYLGMNVYNYINTELMNVLIAFTYIQVPWNSKYQYIAMNVSIILRIYKCQTFVHRY